MEPDPPEGKPLAPEEEQVTERALPASQPPAGDRASSPGAEPPTEESEELAAELILPDKRAPEQWVRPESRPPTGMFELPAWALWGVVAVAGIYLGNFTMGVDVIPDNLPVVGNLDEVVALVIGQQAWVALRHGVSHLFKLKPAG